MTTPSTTSAALDDDPRELPLGLGGAALAVTAWSTGTILAKWLDMGSMAIGVYRFATFFVLLLVWMRVPGDIVFSAGAFVLAAFAARLVWAGFRGQREEPAPVATPAE